jgi:hypothetical protein
MDGIKYRAWIFARQGLEQRSFRTAREALAGAGWSRSVGGVNPYLAIRARTGEGRAQVDALAVGPEIFELPSARGCTYVLPKEHFAIGLAIGKGFGAVTELATARKLGVDDAEIRALKVAIVAALAGGPLAPADLKAALGDRVRNLGDEGRKRGLTTTLPVALGLLQSAGQIRRKPLNGRLDTQRYAYELWQPPLGALPGDEEAAAAVARLFFGWAGAATLKEFREFTAFTVKSAQAACDHAGIVALEESTPLLALPGARAEYDAYRAPEEPAYALVGNMDTFLATRRGSAFWLETADRDRQVPGEKGLLAVGDLAELWSHAILDRGRLIGLWEFDADEGRIVWSTWVRVDDALRAKVAETEAFIRDDLGDARSFSLDSPASRRPRLDALRAMGRA